MFKLNKKELEDYLIKIFDFIENGDSKFNGHPGLYFFHTKKELEEKINELLNKNKYDEFDIYYITSLLIKFMLGRYDSHTKVSFKDNVYIPIDFTVEENSLYITNITPIYKKLIGCKLLKINNTHQCRYPALPQSLRMLFCLLLIKPVFTTFKVNIDNYSHLTICE